MFQPVTTNATLLFVHIQNSFHDSLYLLPINVVNFVGRQIQEKLISSHGHIQIGVISIISLVHMMQLFAFIPLESCAIYTLLLTSYVASINVGQSMWVYITYTLPNSFNFHKFEPPYISTI